MTRSAIIVFARMSSTRLPGKALLDFGGMPLIAWIIRRAEALGPKLIVATSSARDDDALASAVAALGVDCYRGALDDVRRRALDCAAAFGLDVFARLCADRPYFDGNELMRALAFFDSDPTLDLISNVIPAKTAAGLSTEVVRVTALERARALAPEADAAEHLTLGIYRHASAFTVRFLDSPAQGARGRYAVDTAGDLESLTPKPGWQPTVALADVRKALADG